jgi:hypothetical protein
MKPSKKNLTAVLLISALGIGSGVASFGTAAANAAPTTCTSPTFTSKNPNATDDADRGSGQDWWVNNDAWSGSHGPQTINVCSKSSWYAVSQQPNHGGAVETYPDTEYDVGGRAKGTTKPISAYSSITSRFAETNSPGGSWDAAYDLWTDNWKHETMIWNQWAGAQAYWPRMAKGSGGFALSLDGVPYHFYANGKELMFFRDTQVASGSVDILAAYQWEVAHGFAKASDIPTQIEYGTEVASTKGAETFNVTALHVKMVPDPA